MIVIHSTFRLLITAVPSLICIVVLLNILIIINTPVLYYEGYYEGAPVPYYYASSLFIISIIRLVDEFCDRMSALRVLQTNK